jgi:hypothetical protein
LKTKKKAPVDQLRRQLQTRHRVRQVSKLREASERWDTLAPAEQMALALEIARTREQELRLAYPDILSVGAGYASKGRGQRRRFKDIVCVRFMVAKKWPSQSPLKNSPRALPRHLWCYASINGERVLCAAPTDVACGTDYARIKPHSDSGLISAQTADGQGGEQGVITCAVHIPGDTQGLYALGCLHVFCLTAAYWPSVPSVTITNGSGASIAQSSRYHGAIVDNVPNSCDAALAVATDSDAVLQAIAGPRPKLFAQSKDQLPGAFTICTARGKISATKPTLWVGSQLALPYPTPKGTYHVSQPEIVESSAATQDGDSGSPVVSLDGSLLLGMHIAGDGQTAFMIPTFELMRTDNYQGLPPGQFLALA